MMTTSTQLCRFTKRKRSIRQIRMLLPLEQQMMIPYNQRKRFNTLQSYLRVVLILPLLIKSTCYGQGESNQLRGKTIQQSLTTLTNSMDSKQNRTNNNLSLQLYENQQEKQQNVRENYLYHTREEQDQSDSVLRFESDWSLIEHFLNREQKQQHTSDTNQVSEIERQKTNGIIKPEGIKMKAVIQRSLRSLSNTPGFPTGSNPDRAAGTVVSSRLWIIPSTTDSYVSPITSTTTTTTSLKKAKIVVESTIPTNPTATVKNDNGKDSDDGSSNKSDKNNYENNGDNKNKSESTNNKDDRSDHNSNNNDNNKNHNVNNSKESIDKHIDTSNTNMLKREDLRAIIHIGPMKTGSSAIQKAYKYTQAPLLHKDYYSDIAWSFHGTNIHTWDFAGCYRTDLFDDAAHNNDNDVDDHHQQQHNNKRHLQQRGVQKQPSRKLLGLNCNRQSIDLMTEISTRDHHHLIISAEYLTYPKLDVESFAKHIKEYWPKEQIVVAYYRRYYEWLVSLHNQIFKYKLPPERMSIVELVRKEVQSQTKWKRDYLINAVARYKQYFDTVRVYNLHDPDEIPDHDVTIHFYCKALVNATNACNEYKKYSELEKAEEKSKQGTRDLSNSHLENLSIPLVYSELVYFAIQMKLVPLNGQTVFDRVYNSNLIQLTKEYHESKMKRTMYNFGYNGKYLVCPTSMEYDWLLQKSLDVENDLFPEYYQRTGHSEIMMDYDRIRNTMLCHHDIERLLKDDVQWQNFFKSIK